MIKARDLREQPEDGEEVENPTFRVTSLEDIEANLTKPATSAINAEPVSTPEPPLQTHPEEHVAAMATGEHEERPFTARTTNIGGETLDDLAKQPGVGPDENEGAQELADVGQQRIELESGEIELNIPHIKAQAPSSGVYGGHNRAEFSNSNSFPNKYAGGDKKGGASKLHLVILALIGVAVIGGTVYLLKGQFTQVGTVEEDVNVLSTSPTPTIEPSPSPTPIDRAKYKLRILNGTTKAGLASSVSTKLKELGYQTDKAANAPKQDYKQTVVAVKAGANGLAEQVIKDLASDFDASVSATVLKDGDSADVEVILGLK